MSDVINAKGWDPWDSEEKQKTAFYAEYGSSGPGAHKEQRADWSHQLSDQEVQKYTLPEVLGDWDPGSGE